MSPGVEFGGLGVTTIQPLVSHRLFLMRNGEISGHFAVPLLDSAIWCLSLGLSRRSGLVAC